MPTGVVQSLVGQPWRNKKLRRKLFSNLQFWTNAICQITDVKMELFVFQTLPSIIVHDWPLTAYDDMRPSGGCGSGRRSSRCAVAGGRLHR